MEAKASFALAGSDCAAPIRPHINALTAQAIREVRAFLQYMVLCVWLLGTAIAFRRGWRWWRAALAALLPLSMGAQLFLLWLDDRLTLELSVPLHLCAFSGLLCVPMLLTRWRAPLSWMLYLGAPGALLALVFPAILLGSRPTLMRLAFYQAHTLILCATVWRALEEHSAGRPLDGAARDVCLWANVYLLAVSAFNRAFGTNYLFLRAAPANTPLALMAARGSAAYLLTLEMALFLLLTLLDAAYRRVSPSPGA